MWKGASGGSFCLSMDMLEKVAEEGRKQGE